MQSMWYHVTLGPLPKIKISIFLLSICTDELISAPNIIMLSPNPLPKISTRIKSNIIARIFILSESAFPVKLTAQNKNVQA